jgi:hypothetical protein
MSVDLKSLPADEEHVRTRLVGDAKGDPVQNVLDALNYYRCLAADAESRLALAKAALIMATGRRP